VLPQSAPTALKKLPQKSKSFELNYFIVNLFEDINDQTRYYFYKFD
jgi:hypothetical protein